MRGVCDTDIGDSHMLFCIERNGSVVMTFLAWCEERRRRLYREYRNKRMDRAEYLQKLHPIDRQIDRLEMDRVPGIPLWERADALRFRSKKG